MLAPRTRDPGKDQCYRPLGLLESLIFMAVFVFFVVVFLLVLLIIFPCIMVNEEIAFSGCVISFKVPDTGPFPLRPCLATVVYYFNPIYEYLWVKVNTSVAKQTLSLIIILP